MFEEYSPFFSYRVLPAKKYNKAEPDAKSRAAAKVARKARRKNRR